MQYLLPIFYTVFFIFLIYKLPFFKLEGISFKILAPIFLIKVLSGVVLALIYQYYYDAPRSSDVYKYFLDGKVIYGVLQQNPIDYLKLVTGIGSNADYLHKYLDNTEFWFKSFNYGLLNDNRFVIRVHAVLSIISFGKFWVHSVIFSFLSFAGLTAIFKVFSQYFKQKYLLLLAVFFVPSVMFWASAALKESLIVAMLGMLIYSFFNIINNKNLVQNSIFFVLSILLMLLLKFYVLFALIPGLIAYFIIIKFNIKNTIVVFSSVYAVIILLFFNSELFSTYNLSEIISQKQHDFNNMLDAMGTAGSRVILPILEPNFWSVLKAIPNALLNSFFRPFFGDITSVIVIPALIENILIVLLMILSALFFNLKKVKNNLLIILFIASFVITLFILVGMTTPVLGALVRYKVPALPFLFMLFLFFIDFEKIKKMLFRK